MRILFVLASLFILAGCESMDFTSVTVSSGYSHYYPTNHISYTLGYYSGNYYNGYRVYGNHGHRYYHAPRNYRYHRHFARPVVVQHVHVHTSYCEHNYRPRNHYTPPSHTPPRHRPRTHTRNDTQHRDVTPTPRPRATPPRQRQHVAPPRTQPQVRNDRRVEREDRVERGNRGRDRERKRK